MLAPTVIVLLVTVSLLLGLAALAWQSRTKPGAVVFVILQGLSAVWALLTAIGLTLPPGALRLRLWGITTGTSLLVGVVWLAFVLSYLGRDHWLTVRRFGLAAAPLVAGAGLYVVVPDWSLLAGPLTQESIGAGTVISSSQGPVGAVLGVYIYAVFLSGLGLVLKTVLDGPRLFAGQGVAFVLGSMVTIVASALVIAGIPTAGYPLTQVMLSVQALLWGYAVFGHEFLRAVPAVAEIGERAVFDEIDDGVLVVNTEGTVIRSNPRASAYLGVDELTGGRIERLLDLPDVAVPEDLPTRFQRDGRTYQVKASTIRNWRGEPVGHAVAVQDITLLVRRQQRLEVLNRILRHNVRNDMNVVVMVGDELRDRDEERLTELGETLHRKTEELTSISEKALEIDRAFDEPAPTHCIDLAALVEDVVSSLTLSSPETTVRTTVTAGAVRTDPRILSLVLEEVLENALEHTCDEPEIQLAVSDTEAGIEIAVTDNGSGIPEAEYSPIVDGGETALHHASSLGLWIVHWGVQSLGGEMDITTADDGSTVTLSIPDVSESDGHTQESAEGALAQSHPAEREVLQGSPDTTI